jgi:hypothetical protein
MIRVEASVLIERPVEDVFRFVAVDFFDNYRKWSPEVAKLEKTSLGPIGIGTTGRQVRYDAGRRSDTRFRVNRYVAQRRLSFVSLGKPHYRVDYRFEPAADGTRLTFAFEVVPALHMLPFRGLIGETLERGGQRVVASLKVLLEAGSQSGAPA